MIYDSRCYGKKITTSGVHMNANTIKPYEFSDLKLVDEDDGICCTDDPITANVGSIRMKVYRGYTGSLSTRDVPCLPNDWNKSFSAQAKSGLTTSSQTVFAKEEKINFKRQKVEWTEFDSPGAPWFEFVFYYRKREVLETFLGISFERSNKSSSKKRSRDTTPHKEESSEDPIKLNSSALNPGQGSKEEPIDLEETPPPPQPLWKKPKHANDEDMPLIKVIIVLD
ncbi:hypothetical protein BT69DRAFT_1332105 [Atractiella rhizophila]|nr:hypothetical protein BT69DRAFT_1332105 [Atractiella rhizophila]